MTKFLRQTFVGWAGLSVCYSFWAKASLLGHDSWQQEAKENPIIPSSDHWHLSGYEFYLGAGKHVRPTMNKLT
nr:hypothetical protein [Pseudoalteromonas aliena]